MKKASLLLTGIACLATSGVATVFADKATTSPGSETVRGQGGAITDMDEVGNENYHRGRGGEKFSGLDINNDGFLNAQELSAYGASSAGQDLSGPALVERLDQNNDDVITPQEFQSGDSATK
ncbi:MAG: hypothetical protein CL583_15370 [Alteromonadaceae bacterium]|nr:hypothetical protein [Alteromonadaceae bacterium]|tara:strand:- start:1719 stop:2084 length:366 start_codon:yes stop_codon:yes gene_type:complete